MFKKWEKAQPSASNKIRETGEVEREEKAIGFVERNSDEGKEGPDDESEERRSSDDEGEMVCDTCEMFGASDGG